MARRKQSTTRRELVSDQILDQAAALFAERGFSGTSLQDVADALGISRTALYHYIGGKEELLATLVRGITGETAASLERLADDDSLSAPEKVVEAVRGMTMRIASNPARFRLLLLSESALKEPLASEHHDARRRTLEALSRIIDDGVSSGSLRPVESHLAAFALLGMCNWVAWWYQPERDGAQPPEQVADVLANVGMQGLRAGEGRAVPADGDPVEHAVGLLREDLSSLERALAAAPSRRRRRS